MEALTARRQVLQGTVTQALWIALSGFRKLDDLSSNGLTNWVGVSGVARSDPSAISKAMPIKRTVSLSKLWASKKVLIGMRRGSNSPAPVAHGRESQVF